MDGSQDRQEVYPIKLAEYAVVNEFVSEPVFAWWVLWCTLKKRKAVLKVVHRRVLARKKESLVWRFLVLDQVE